MNTLIRLAYVIAALAIGYVLWWLFGHAILVAAICFFAVFGGYITRDSGEHIRNLVLVVALGFGTAAGLVAWIGG